VFSELEYISKSLRRDSSQGLVNEDGMHKRTILFDLTSRKPSQIMKADKDRGKREKNVERAEKLKMNDRRQSAENEDLGGTKEQIYLPNGATQPLAAVSKFSSDTEH
jgi:hypothetical protein